MHGILLEVGWDVILLAILVFAVLVPGFSRLDRLIASVKNEERGTNFGFESPAWDADADRHPVEI